MRKLAHIFCLVAIFGAFAAYAKPVSDRKLERRLVVLNKYHVKPGDTLHSIARLLYGHETWWVKFRKWNPKLSKQGPDRRLKSGSLVRYKAPKIGSLYVVQKGDWLVRIAQWKYGSTDYWESLFRKNAQAIKNPNLIHPGDQLALDPYGTVRNLRTGSVIVQGTQGAHELPAQPPAPSVPAPLPIPTKPPLTFHIGNPPPPPKLIFGIEETYFFAGFAAGIALLLIGPLFWWFRARSRHSRPTSTEDFSGSGSRSEPEPVTDDEEDLEPLTPPTPFRDFKRRPADDLEVDRSRLPEVTGEVDRRPGYHSLTEKPWKRYLRASRKR